MPNVDGIGPEGTNSNEHRAQSTEREEGGIATVGLHVDVLRVFTSKNSCIRFFSA